MANFKARKCVSRMATVLKVRLQANNHLSFLRPMHLLHLSSLAWLAMISTRSRAVVIILPCKLHTALHLVTVESLRLIESWSGQLCPMPQVSRGLSPRPEAKAIRSKSARTLLHQHCNGLHSTAMVFPHMPPTWLALCPTRAHSNECNNVP